MKSPRWISVMNTFQKDDKFALLFKNCYVAAVAPIGSPTIGQDSDVAFYHQNHLDLTKIIQRLVYDYVSKHGVWLRVRSTFAVEKSSKTQTRVLSLGCPRRVWICRHGFSSRWFSIFVGPLLVPRRAPLFVLVNRDYCTRFVHLFPDCVLTFLVM